MTEYNAVGLFTASIEFYRMRKQVRETLDKLTLAMQGLAAVRERYLQERAKLAAMGLPFESVDENIAIVDNLLAALQQP